MMVATLMTAYAVDQRYGLDPHGQAARCESCHLGQPPEGAVPPGADASAAGVRYGLRYDRERAVCERCHVEHNQQTHPVEVKPSMKTPAAWPLDPQGRLACSTCHDPHHAAGAASRRLLRGDKSGAAFCQECHGELQRGDSRSWHIVMAQTAHGSEGTAADARATLDPTSTRCLSCHDGTAGRDVGYRLGQRSLDVGGGRSHPVGVRYVADAVPRKEGDRGPSLRNPAFLDKRLRLFDGKVGCGTCHDLYSTNRKFLAIDTRGGRLCRSCHDM